MNNYMLAHEVRLRLLAEGAALPEGLTEKLMQRLLLVAREVLIERLAEGEEVQLKGLGTWSPYVIVQSAQAWREGTRREQKLVKFNFKVSDRLRERAKANEARGCWVGGRRGKQCDPRRRRCNDHGSDDDDDDVTTM